jgi:hypothetical protein
MSFKKENIKVANSTKTSLKLDIAKSKRRNT